MNSHYTDFITYMSRFGSIEHLTGEISKYLTRITVPKKHILLQEGAVCNYVYFLEKGLIRTYYKHEDEEITSLLLHEQQFVTAVQSFYWRRPSLEIIETLEPSTIVMAHYSDMMNFCDNNHEFLMCMFRLFQNYLAMRDANSYSLRVMDAKERYENLCQRDADLVERAPAKVIASYLNITQETLSRVRKSIKNRDLNKSNIN